MAETITNNFISTNDDIGVNHSSKPGLVVTISRQKGCGAIPIAKLILDKLNALNYPGVKLKKWKMISKQILEESAEELKLGPGEVDSIIDMNAIRKVLLSFSQKSLPRDVTVKKAIHDVILNAARQGNVIIVGRGGVSIARNIENSLHIKLLAPYEWRVRKIATKGDMSIQEADKIVKERDRQRDAFKQYFLGAKDADIHFYDLAINVSTMKKSEVADSIFGVIKMRQDALIHAH